MAIRRAVELSSSGYPASAEPFEASDAEIERALASASIPTLLMSMIHVTGDASPLRGPIRPGPAMMGETQGGLSDTEKAQVRAQALRALCAYRDGGCRLPPQPGPETIREMLSFVVGQEVPDEYVPMMLEEMALDGGDPRQQPWRRSVAEEEKRRFPVAVIGAGMSGILAAIRLREAGLPVTLIEKNPGFGGTWLENRYPGCRVDVANHFYCYSFEPNPDWSEFFCRGPELLRYFERCAERHGLRDCTRFETEVTRARYREESGEWQLSLRGPTGREETLSARALVSAVGQLNRPKLPDIPGRERFRGPAFHSARWPADLDLSGRRVAVIGTGASALQIVPELAKTAGELRVFQRSPAWMLPNPHYHRPVGPGKRWLLRHVPFYARWYRFLLFWPGSDGLLPSLAVDPNWPQPERSVNATNEQMRSAFIEYMRAQLGGDEELLARVTPDYPPFGKRILQDNGSWLSALRRENTRLVTDPIHAIDETGVLCESGERHALDAIVFATGFHANRFLWPMQIRGRGGALLSERWGEDPSAYLGITVPDFPNLFCLYGPGTNLAHAGSIIFHSECQVRYVLGCLQQLIERRARAMDCRAEVHDAYVQRFDAAHRGLVWSHPGMRSWYKNARGRVTTTSPWRLVDYWSWTREPDPNDYEWLY